MYLICFLVTLAGVVRIWKSGSGSSGFGVSSTFGVSPSFGGSIGVSCGVSSILTGGSSTYILSSFFFFFFASAFLVVDNWAVGRVSTVSSLGGVILGGYENKDGGALDLIIYLGI